MLHILTQNYLKSNTIKLSFFSKPGKTATGIWTRTTLKIWQTKEFEKKLSPQINSDEDCDIPTINENVIQGNYDLYTPSWPTFNYKQILTNL